MGHDGMLSLAEFRGLLEIPEFQHMLSIFEVGVHDAEKLFLEVAEDKDDDGEVEVKEDTFVDAIVSAHQGVTGADMIGLLRNQEQTRRKITDIERFLHSWRNDGLGADPMMRGYSPAFSTPGESRGAL